MIINERKLKQKKKVKKENTGVEREGGRGGRPGEKLHRHIDMRKLTRERGNNIRAT